VLTVMTVPVTKPSSCTVASAMGPSSSMCSYRNLAGRRGAKQASDDAAQETWRGPGCAAAQGRPGKRREAALLGSAPPGHHPKARPAHWKRLCRWETDKGGVEDVTCSPRTHQRVLECRPPAHCSPSFTGRPPTHAHTPQLGLPHPVRVHPGRQQATNQQHCHQQHCRWLT